MGPLKLKARRPETYTWVLNSKELLKHLNTQDDNINKLLQPILVTVIGGPKFTSGRLLADKSIQM